MLLVFRAAENEKKKATKSSNKSISNLFISLQEFGI